VGAVAGRLQFIVMRVAYRLCQGARQEVSACLDCSNGGLRQQRALLLNDLLYCS